MKLASISPGTSAAPLPSRILADLTPNGGGGGARQVHTFYKYSTIHTYKKGGLELHACAFDGGCGIQTRGGKSGH